MGGLWYTSISISKFGLYYTPWYVVCGIHLYPYPSSAYTIHLGMWYVVCGMWYVVCGMWYMVCGMWYVVCGMWYTSISISKFGLYYTPWYVVCGMWHVPM